MKARMPSLRSTEARHEKALFQIRNEVSAGSPPRVVPLGTWRRGSRGRFPFRRVNFPPDSGIIMLIFPETSSLALNNGGPRDSGDGFKLSSSS